MDIQEYGTYLANLVPIIFDTYKAYFYENVILQTKYVLNDVPKLLFSLSAFTVFVFLVLVPAGKLIIALIKPTKTNLLIEAGLGLVFLALIEHFLSYALGAHLPTSQFVAIAAPVVYLFVQRKTIAAFLRGKTLKEILRAPWERIKRWKEQQTWKSVLTGVLIAIIAQSLVIPMYGTGIASTDDGNMYMSVWNRETGIHSAYASTVDESIPPMHPYFHNAQLRYYYFSSSILQFTENTTTIDPYVIQHLLLPEIALLIISITVYYLVFKSTSRRFLGITAIFFYCFSGTFVLFLPQFQDVWCWCGTKTTFQQGQYITGITYPIAHMILFLAIWILLNLNRRYAVSTGIILGILLSTTVLTKIMLAESILLALICMFGILTGSYIIHRGQRPRKEIHVLLASLSAFVCFGAFFIAFSMGLPSETYQNGQKYLPGARVAALLEGNPQLLDEVEYSRLRISTQQSTLHEPEMKLQRTWVITKFATVFILIEFSLNILGFIYCIVTAIRKRELTLIFISTIIFAGIAFWLFVIIDYFNEFQFLATTVPLANIFTCIPIFYGIAYVIGKTRIRKKNSVLAAVCTALILILYSPTSIGSLKRWSLKNTHISQDEYEAASWVRAMNDSTKKCLFNPYNEQLQKTERDVYLAGIAQCTVPTATAGLARTNALHFTDPELLRIEMENMTKSPRALAQYLEHYDIDFIISYKQYKDIPDRLMPSTYRHGFENNEINIYIRNP